MSAATKRALAIAAILLGLAIAIYAVFSRKSDEELIRERIERLARAVRVESPDENPIFRAKRLKNEFDELLSPSVKVEIPELAGFTTGRDDLLGLATRAGSSYRRAEIELKRVAITLDDEKRSAKADVTAELNAERGGEPERDERHVAFELHKDAQGWLIDRVSVAAKGD